MINTTLSLRYKIELGANGVIEGSIYDCYAPTVTSSYSSQLPKLGGSPSISERLKLLNERRQAWRTLDFKRRVIVPIPGACQAYELVGGMFAKAMRQGTRSVGNIGDDYNHEDEALIMGIDTDMNRSAFSRHFDFIDLPSSSHSPVLSAEGIKSDSRGSQNKELTPITRNDIGVSTRDFCIDPTQDLIALIEGPTR